MRQEDIREGTDGFKPSESTCMLYPSPKKFEQFSVKILATDSTKD